MNRSISLRAFVACTVLATSTGGSASARPGGAFAAKPVPILYASAFLNGTIEEYDQSGRSQRPFASIPGLSESIGLAVDSHGNLYVGQSGSVVEFARGANKPLKTYDDGGHQVGGVTVCPNGTLYAANSEGDTLSVYAGGATEPTGTIVIPNGQVFHLACDATNDVFVTVAGGAYEVIEVPANGSGPIGLPIAPYGFPEGIAIDRAGDIVVAQIDDSALAFYHNGQSTPFKTIAVPGEPLEVTFSEHDKTVWAANSTEIFRFTVADGRLTDTIPLEAGGIAASPED